MRSLLSHPGYSASACAISPDTHFKVFAIGVYGSDHHLVAENKFKIDPVRGDLDHLVSAGDAGEHEDSVLSQGLHAVKDNAGVSRTFEDDDRKGRIPWPRR